MKFQLPIGSILWTGIEGKALMMRECLRESIKPKLPEGKKPLAKHY